MVTHIVLWNYIDSLSEEQKKEAGDSVTVQYWRNGNSQETTIVLVSADLQEN